MIGDLQFSVDYDADIPCVTMLWRGYAASAVFRAANEQVLAAIRERRAKRILADVADFVLIGQEDQDWLNQDWLPRAIEAGLRYCAMVEPTFHFNRVAVHNVGGRIDPRQLTLAYFPDRDSALAWLRAPAPPKAIPQ
jgi:hypothetical protein